MNALEDVFGRCRAEGRAALVAYLPAGYPDLPTSLDAYRAVVEAGADVVEVGVPYTDPLMDGPVIQAATEQALHSGFRFADTLTCVGAVAAAGGVPVVMSYWNPVLRHGVDRFAAELAEAGGAGLITPDLIPDEAGEWLAASDAHGLDRVFLVAPSSTTERLALTARASRGFVYAASTMGVTGVRTSVDAQARRLVEDTRRAGAERVCVGLGVSTPEQAAEVAGYADGVIVGSVLVRALLEAPTPAAGLARLGRVAEGLAAGVRGGAA